MDYYDDDFEEDIADDSIGKELTPQKQTPIKKTRLPTISSQPNLKSQGGVRGISGDKNTRGSIRKALVLTKAQPKRDSQDYYMPPLKNISQPKSLNKYSIEDSARRNYTPTHSDVPQMGFKKRIIKEFDLESLGISRSSVKKSSRSTPRALEPVVITYAQRFKDVLDSDKTVKSVKELEIENIKLRDHLKELNGQLTQIVERAKNTLLPPKKVEFKNKDVEARVKTLSKEISNQQQILEFSFAEYTTLKARLDKLKDHDYAIDLDERIQEIVQQTEEIRRKNKAISAKAGSLAKDLKVIETKDGVPPAVVEANEKGRELALTRKKTRKMQEDNKAFREEAKRKNEKYEKVQKEYKKLCKEAEKHNLTAEANKLAVHYKYLQNQIKSLEDGIKFASNTNEKFVQNQLEKDIEELHLENLKENEALTKLEEMLAQQRAALKNMIETEVSPVDRETKEVLKRIKHAIEPENLEDSTSPAEIKVSHPKKNKSLGNLHSKPPITANKKVPNEMYADLPLYSSPLEKKKDSYKENKEMIKKELSAIREQARRDVEENKSRSPEKPVKEEKKVVKEKFELHPAKPTSKKESPIEEVLKPKEDKPWFAEKAVEQNVKKSEPEDSSVGLKPAFSKPNLFKKNKGGNDDLLFNNEPLSLGDKPKENMNNNEFKLSMQPEVKKDNLWDMPKKEEPLKLDALGNGKTSQNAFSTEPFGVNKKKEELIIPGSGSLTVQPKQVEPPKKSELILGDNLKPTPKQPEQNNEEDLGEGFNIGGISRLNRVKRVPNNHTSSFGEPEKKEVLQLPGQKPLELGNGTQSLSLNKNNDLWLESNKNQITTKQLELELPGSNTKPDNKLQLNDAFGGNKNKTPNELSDLNTELLAGGFGQPRRAGRDRTHLFGKQDEQDPFVANTNTTTGATNAKSNFDPDDLFVSNNKVNNVESKTGLGNAGGFGAPVANTNINNNPVGGAGVGGIPGVRTGRGGVATRPKQVNAFDDDMFGAEKKATVVTQGSFGFGGSTNNQSINRQATNVGAGFGGAAVATPETNKEQGAVKENNSVADQQPKRMRMGDAQQKAEVTREREKQLANKAHVDGFFGDFDF